MLISEIFHSIQGEGELTGIPSVFIRTAGCNLRCGWCDTPYASWKPEGEKMSVAEILTEIEPYPSRHVVLTGGEPMIAPGIHELAAALREQGRHITIETAATVAPEGIACDLASLSPKLANSSPANQLPPDDPWIAKHETTRHRPDIVSEWLRDYAFQLKFVVSSAADLGEIQCLLGELRHEVPPHKVLLMPEGRDAATTHGRDTELIDLCKQHGYRYCARLHIDLFGNRRGT